MTFNPFGSGVYTLASSISSTATSITLTSFTEPVSGTPYTMVLLNTSIAYGTIAPKTASSEFISFTGITQNADGTATLTGVTRGLAKKSPFTASATFQLPHSGQSQFIISDVPQLFKKYGALENSEVITGQWEAPDPITAQGLVTRDYMLALINGGSISVNSVIVQGVAGETISAGNLVYLKQSDGFWWLTDADTISTLNGVQLGIAQGAGTAGNPISSGIMTFGVDTHNTGTAGGFAYASNTPGGISSSPGTNSFTVGQFIPSLGGIYFDPFVYQSDNSGAITSDEVSTGLYDQSQTTQNSSSTIGEANTTGLRNKVAQSFIPQFTKMRGVSMYKSADTGAFTGTVTIALQADSSGNPSGSNLASVTLTNAQWNSFAVGAFEAVFSAEYSSMVQGSLYWIVISTSTSDTSNHPNLGINTAGGYANGSAKYNNTTDGWVAIATIDFYFQTLQGTASQIVKTNTSGKIESTFYDVTELPLPAYFQDTAFTAQTIPVAAEFVWGTNATGSVFYVCLDNGGLLYRFARDAVTGMYFQTHAVSHTITLASGDISGIIQIGTFIYVFSNDGTNIICSRFVAADLTSETVMTVPTVACTATLTAWTDGVYAYLISNSSGTTTRKWSVSGTVFSAVSTSTAVAGLTSSMTMFDGTNLYISAIDYSVGSPTAITIKRLADVTASAVSATTVKVQPLFSDQQISALLLNIDATRMYIGIFYVTYNDSVVLATRLSLFPITKP